MSESSIDVDDLQEGAEWLWDNWDKIRGRLAELARWLRGKKPAEQPPDAQRGILILGPQGVGKSTFAQLITDAVHPLADVPVNYDESHGVESYTLLRTKQGRDIELIVLPGQKHRRADSWPGILKDIGLGRFRGIILFSAFGYHALGAGSYKSHALYGEHGRRKGQFLTAYLESCRQDELVVLRELAAYVKTCPTPIWMLSVVTKQDLWWKERASVELHYQNGDYSAIIDDVTRHRGATQFRHESAFVSLVIRRLMTGHGEVLKNNLAGYDQELQLASLRRLAATIDSLRIWEVGS